MFFTHFIRGSSLSTSILYRAIGLGGYRHVAAWEEKGEFKLRVQPPESAICCPGCGSNDVIHLGTYDRRVHAPPIGLRETVVFIRAPPFDELIKRFSTNLWT